MELRCSRCRQGIKGKRRGGEEKRRDQGMQARVKRYARDVKF